MKLILLFLVSFSAFSAFLPESFSVDITQSYLTQLKSGKTKISKGKIDYEFPGKLRYKNDELTFVANNKKSWHFTPTVFPGEKNDVVISSKNHLVGKLFDALKKGLTNNNLYTVDKKTDSHFMLNFTQAGKESFRLKSVEFFAYNNNKKEKTLKDIKRMSLEYIDSKSLNIEFRNFKVIDSFPASHFVFKVPKNTKIITQ